MIHQNLAEIQMGNFFYTKISQRLSVGADLKGASSIWLRQMTTMIQSNVRNVKRVIGSGFEPGKTREGQMNTYQAYQHEVSRLTEEEKLSLNAKENNIGRKLLPYEIVTIFKLEPSEKVTPRKRRMSDEVESWVDQ